MTLMTLCCCCCCCCSPLSSFSSPFVGAYLRSFSGHFLTWDYTDAWMTTSLTGKLTQDISSLSRCYLFLSCPWGLLVYCHASKLTQDISSLRLLSFSAFLKPPLGCLFIVTAWPVAVFDFSPLLTVCSLLWKFCLFLRPWFACLLSRRDLCSSEKEIPLMAAAHTFRLSKYFWDCIFWICFLSKVHF